MKNADLIRRLPKLAELRREVTATEHEARAAWARLEKLTEEISALEHVSEVCEGVALSRYGGFISAVGDEIKRAAEIYPNVHTNGATYGLHTYSDSFTRKGARWWGADWPSKAAADAAAVAWVIRGELPTDDSKPV